MNRMEARKLAKQLHKAGVQSVRLVEWIEDGDYTLLVSNNNGLETVAQVEDYIRRNIGE